MANVPLKLASIELRRFHTPLARLALLFILVVPVLYGAIYLAGNWDPYGKLDRVPVAVVNHDKPVEVNGETLDAGKDFSDSLIKKQTFKFEQTDAQDAKDGLREGRYYLVVTIPEDFSAKLSSGQNLSPERANILLERNDANGFVIGSITNQAQNSIALALDETAVKAYFEAVFANLNTIRAGMVKAAEGAAKLDTGAAQASKGATQLNSGLKTASSSSVKLAQGSKQLSDGVGKASAGADQLSTGLGTIDASTGKLAAGADQVAGGTQQLANTLDPILQLSSEKLPGIQADARKVSSSATQLTSAVNDGQGTLNQDVNQVNTSMAELAAKYPELANDPAYAKAQSAVGRVKQRADRITATTQNVASTTSQINNRVQGMEELGPKAAAAKRKVDQLNSGAHQVASGAHQLKGGTAQASAASKQLSAGLRTAKTGSAQVAKGNAELSTGLGKLSTGANSLDGGLKQLASGSHELATELKKGANQIPVISGDKAKETAAVLAKPVDVKMTVDNPATFYGRGLAPMFFSIALWVWGISAFMVMRPITGRLLSGRASTFRLALSAYLPTAMISTAAAWLMLAVAWIGLDLNPVHPWLIIGLVTLTALAFSAFAHLMRTALGLVATAALLVILIVQLSGAGGTYPAVLLPGFFRALNPFMPMTYSIDAFRIAISGGLMSKFVIDLCVLGGMLLASFGALLLVVHRKRVFTMKDLHPPL